ncbi:Tubulin-specific chaperone E, partial [Termitomyces sp. T112]
MISPRINLAGYLGTVRYTGPVEGTSGTWLGIEWDDHTRGKHDGVNDGKRYFTCRVPNSGSFIRPSPNVSYGRSFLEALTSKYIETPRGSASQEKVILGSSQGSILVEAVNLDKIRGKLADLGRLREVSL